MTRKTRKSEKEGESRVAKRRTQNTQVGNSRSPVRTKNAGAKFHIRKRSVFPTQSFLQIRKLNSKC